jgi:hypothetical protein
MPGLRGQQMCVLFDVIKKRYRRAEQTYELKGMNTFEELSYWYVLFLVIVA